MGEPVSLPRSSVVLGRDRTAEIHVHDVGVSRRHARISYESNLYHVEDLDSINGTFVNSKRVSRTELKNGDCVQLGPRVSFRFTLMDGTQEEVIQRLYDSSVRDPLTGVCNRRHLDSRLAAEVSHAMRHNANVSVVLFDIDFFKGINDTHGHNAGDEVLRTIAELSRRGLRTEDIVARYGGEEFAIVLRDTPVEGAHVVAERLRRQVAKTSIALGSLSIGVTVSAGCASLRCEEGLGVKTLVDLADRRLYRAKKEGRNRVIST